MRINKLSSMSTMFVATETTDQLKYQHAKRKHSSLNVPIQEEANDELVSDSSDRTKRLKVATTATSEVVPPINLNFPQKLRIVLDDEANHSIIRWHTHGLAFKVFLKDEFEQTILPQYFQKQSKYWSFTRKLGRWGFIRTTSGPESGSYCHPLFKRDEPDLIMKMSCQSTSSSAASNNEPSNNEPTNHGFGSTSESSDSTYRTLQSRTNSTMSGVFTELDIVSKARKMEPSSNDTTPQGMKADLRDDVALSQETRNHATADFSTLASADLLKKLADSYNVDSNTAAASLMPFVNDSVRTSQHNLQADLLLLSQTKFLEAKNKYLNEEIIRRYSEQQEKMNAIGSNNAFRLSNSQHSSLLLPNQQLHRTNSDSLVDWNMLQLHQLRRSLSDTVSSSANIGLQPHHASLYHDTNRMADVLSLEQRLRLLANTNASEQLLRLMQIPR